MNGRINGTLQLLGVAALSTIAITGAAAGVAATQEGARSQGVPAEQVIRTWKATPQKVAKTMIEKYGQPQEVTSERLIWHRNGSWKFTELVNEEIAHDFPVPHKDALYQAIDYKVDPATADEVLAYDGSIILERTKGEIAARCDKEEANFLAINLAHDVASGRRSVDDARAFYAQSMMDMMKSNKKGEYLQGFHFKVPSGDQGSPDKPFAAGASKQK